MRDKEDTPEMRLIHCQNCLEVLGIRILVIALEKDLEYVGRDLVNENQTKQEGKV